MKYLLLLLTSLAVQSVSAQYDSRTADSSTFGRHQANCSSGRGACSFTVLSNEIAKAADTKFATKISGATFKLTILRSVLTIADEYRIAGKLFSDIAVGEVIEFVQQDDMTLDNITLTNLSLDLTKNKLYPGNYPLSVLKDRVEIIFTLSN